MDKKINILVIPSDHYGVGLYRSVSPHTKLQELYGDDFNVEINYEPDFKDTNYLDKFDIVHFHKGMFPDMVAFRSALSYCKEHNIVTVMDVDDYWELEQTHPQYMSSKIHKLGDIIKENLKLSDYVTTTTDIFAKKIRPFNKNVVVFPNAIDPSEEQYQPIKNPSDKIRFGFVMGSSHEKDMEQFFGFINAIPKEIRDKIQIVLCGFDLRGTINVIDKATGQVQSRPIQPTESVWFRYEYMLTSGYSVLPEDYRNYLLSFNQNVQWPNVNNEVYRREWTMDVKEFAKHYRNIDVLFAPITETNFNEVKSELKFIEAGFTHTAVVATNFGPYTIGSKSIFEYGGKINEDGNCILIEPRKAHKDWVKAVKKLVENPDLISIMQNNMYETVKDKYDINNVTKNRADWYKSIVKKVILP